LENLEEQVQQNKTITQGVIDGHRKDMGNVAEMLKLKDQELDLKKAEIEVLRKQLEVYKNRQ
jgi:hypothetical protein